MDLLGEVGYRKAVLVVVGGRKSCNTDTSHACLTFYPGFANELVLRFMDLCLRSRV